MKKSLNLPKNSKTFNNHGFTLVEALVGITVAGMVFAAVAPVIMIGISTRVQTQKAQQAMQIAQGEINRIQALMAQGVKVDQEDDKLPPETDTDELIEVGAPRTTVADFASLDDANQAFELNLDKSNDQPEFLVQIFRDEGIRFDQGRVFEQLAVFRVGVRVYSGLAKDNLGDLDTKIASLSMTNSLIEPRTRPLAVIYTEVSQSDVQFSLQRYQDYLNGD